MSAPAHSLDSILDDPRWFPDGFDPQSGILSFVETGPDRLATEPFLDKRWERAGLPRGGVHLALAAAKMAERPLPQRLRLIWHTGFCCSTLLARSLNAPGRNLSLCEPKLLVDAADAKRAGALALHPALAQFPSVAFRLLARSFAPDMAVTIKPSPAANHLLPEAAALPARHLILFSDCESFVVSVFKMRENGSTYVRQMLDVMTRNGVAARNEDDPYTLSDLQAAALLWHRQIAEIRRDAEGLQARSLDCDTLLDDPTDVLVALDDFFALDLGADHIARVAGGPLFLRNAKNPDEAFDAVRRRDEHEAVRKALGAELSETIAWSHEKFSYTPRSAPFSNPLIPTEKVRPS